MTFFRKLSLILILALVCMPAVRAAEPAATAVVTPAVTQATSPDVPAVPTPAGTVPAEKPAVKAVSAAEKPPAGLLDEQIIEDIKVKGNSTVEEKEILDIVSYGVGMAFSKYKTREDIRNLYKTGKFDDVNVSLDKEGDKTVLTYEVKEKPRIGKIVIKGNKDVGEGDIKGKLDDDEKKIKVKELEYFDEYLLNRAIDNIVKLYKEKNFYDVSVNYTVSPYKDEHKRGDLVEVDVVVNEGGKLKVKSITAAGNKVFAVDKIKGVMDTKEEGWFQSGVFDDAKYVEDLKKVLKTYYQEGYVKAKIGKYSIGELDLNKDDVMKASVKIDRDTNVINITIPIDEGIKYTVKSITIEGNKLFSTEELTDKMEIKPEKTFDRIQFETDMNTVRTMYAGKGYIFSQIKDFYVYDDDMGTAAIKLDITEGTVAYINQIKIRGNYVTKDKVIRRELGLAEGEAFDSNKIKRAQENAYNLGFFDNVTIDTEQVDIDKLNLIFEVTEKKTGNIGLGAGYSTVEGLVGYVQLSQSNLFGEGKGFSADVQFGTLNKSWTLSYKDPWLFDTETSFGLDLWNSFKDSAYNNQGYDLDTYGFNLTLGRRIGNDHKVYLTYRYEQDKYSNIESALLYDSVKNPNGIPNGQYQISSITPMYVYDTRDDIFDASTGSYASLALQLGGGYLGGDYNYIKATTDLRYFIPSFWRFVWAFHVKIGDATGFNSRYGSPNTPPAERFYCGGTDTVRGYEERALGPIDGGNFLFVTNIEYKLKLIEKTLTLAAFYDSGNCWNNFSDVDWTNPDLAGSVGLGARLTIPGTVMVLRLDWGYPLMPNTQDSKTGKIHFNIGNIF
jgi:outer membrane protein insertion porin family